MKLQFIIRSQSFVGEFRWVSGLVLLLLQLIKGNRNATSATARIAATACKSPEGIYRLILACHRPIKWELHKGE